MPIKKSINAHGPSYAFSFACTPSGVITKDQINTVYTPIMSRETTDIDTDRTMNNRVDGTVTLIPTQSLLGSNRLPNQAQIQWSSCVTFRHCGSDQMTSSRVSYPVVQGFTGVVHVGCVYPRRMVSIRHISICTSRTICRRNKTRKQVSPKVDDLHHTRWYVCTARAMGCSRHHEAARI